MKQGIFPTATGKGFSLNRETGRPNRELRIERRREGFFVGEKPKAEQANQAFCHVPFPPLPRVL
jgi:hypothetical protein